MKKTRQKQKKTEEILTVSPFSRLLEDEPTPQEVVESFIREARQAIGEAEQGNFSKSSEEILPLNQEQEITLRLVCVFGASWWQKWRGYLAEEGERQEEIFRAGKHTELINEFARYGLDYKKDILPVFAARWWGFIHLWAARKAAKETVLDYQKWLRRYQRPLHLITEKGAPFPEEIKEKLKRMYAWQTKLKLGNMLLRAAQEYIEKDQGIKILDTNVDKAPQKHPVWRELEVELFELLTGKNVSDWKTYRLIERLFKTLAPHWHKTTDADTIRHNIQRRLKTK